jgi:hypothetical protein
MKVLLVTTWDQPCGIAEHSWYLKQAVEAADPEIQITPEPELNPAMLSITLKEQGIDVLHLNYQASLHSRWTPEWIRNFQAVGVKVVVTFHDTGVPNSPECIAILDAADAAVVHEPIGDYPLDGKVHYWRMGVPDWHALMHYDQRPGSWCGPRPILGSIGFAFPWKHYEQLAMVTARAGWALLLIAPNATPEQQIEWRTLNPHSQVFPEFMARDDAISMLAGCDATAFTYVCCNTGQSAALLQGIAARKPVIALKTCRQFRALYDDPLGQEAIDWVATFEEVEDRLRHIPVGLRCDPGIVALAEQESWQKLGQRYAT